MSSTSAADPIPNSEMLRQASARWALGRRPHVCVIGAGIAGLRCSEFLLEHGVEVTIFEGRNRVGGRCHQVKQNGSMADMGPNWIHGTDRNPILALAKETNTTTASISEESVAFDERGETLTDKSRIRELYGLAWGIIGDAFKYSNETKSIPASKSLKDFFVEELEERELSEDDKKIVLQMAEQWSNFIGAPFERQSLKFFWLEESIDGENLFVASTYQKILAKIASSATKGANLHLSTTVTGITSPETSQTPGHGSSVVQTSSIQASSTQNRFDATILTASLGCLKANTPTINPPLPPRLQTAIKNLSYGNLEKAYISFPTAFWSEPSELEPFPMIVNFLHPLYTPTNPENRMVDCMVLSALPKECAQPTLLFYFNGPYAQRTVSGFAKLPPDSQEYFEAVVAAFEPYYSRLPNYDCNLEKCKPVAAVATAWSEDELAGRGSYTNFQVSEDCALKAQEGQDEQAEQEPKSEQEKKVGSEERTKEIRLDEDIEALRRGCPERSLWLAGEHTAPFVALGTVTGAYWSGEAVAKRVVEWFEGKNKAVKGGNEDVKVGTVQVGKPAASEGLRSFDTAET